MSNIKLYIPEGRSNFNPQGKPRVWFTGHPDDVKIYLPILSDDILKISNCAIYYETEEISDNTSEATPDDTPYDEHIDEPVDESALGQMQLFVIPITTKLLSSACRTLKFDYGFAMQHHIPVLPIMMEPGLAGYFTEQLNRIGPSYGDIQFLDHTSTDTTEISYQEKLEKRLNSVLNDDKTAERVRAAFDAYIFMSYRKKDRAYAHELMRLIHQIPFCRDIAIWYDEFLVPGEEWSRTIAEAMAKSVLVTMAITPGITEPGNYIIEHEYPDAVQSGKPILPAQMSEVNDERQAQLQRLFPGLPEMIDGHNPEEMARMLKSIAVPENDNNPEHNFLIGLAYLGAIDVERDDERALELITSAANVGLREAMLKLVDMYTNGEGVHCDYHEAIRWQQKLVEQSRYEYQKHSCEERAELVIGDLGELGSLLRETGRTAEAQRVYEEMRDMCLRAIKAGAQKMVSWYLSVAYEGLGYIEESLVVKGYDGHLKTAKEWYEKSFKIRWSLAEEEGTFQLRQSLCTSYIKLGDIELAQEDWEAARDSYVRSLEISAELADETGSISSQSLICLAYSKLGYVEELKENLEAARIWYKKSLEIGQELAEETEMGAVRKALSDCYFNLGKIEMSQGDLEKAKERYEKSLEIRRNLADKTGTLQSRKDLFIIYSRMGNVRMLQGYLEEAGECYEKSLKIGNELLEIIRTFELIMHRIDIRSHLYFIKELQGLRLDQCNEGECKCRTDKHKDKNAQVFVDYIGGCEEQYALHIAELLRETGYTVYTHETLLKNEEHIDEGACQYRAEEFMDFLMVLPKQASEWNRFYDQLRLHIKWALYAGKNVVLLMDSEFEVEKFLLAIPNREQVIPVVITDRDDDKTYLEDIRSCIVSKPARKKETMRRSEQSKSNGEQEGVPVDEEHFPDSVFREYIRGRFDRDFDGVLSPAEIKMATHLGKTDEDIEDEEFCNMRISDLRGIEYLTSLQVLYCCENNLTRLNVSGLTELRELDCSSNKLISLNVTGCTALKIMFCYSNMLMRLDVSGLIELQELHCSYNKLISLNTTGCTALNRLDCCSNRLVKIDVSTCVSLRRLDCSDNRMTGLNLTGCSNLNDLYCNHNQLTGLDLRGLSELVFIECTNNRLRVLDVSNCESLDGLDISWQHSEKTILIEQGRRLFNSATHGDRDLYILS